MIQVSMIIFQNTARSYPIRGVSDNSPEFSTALQLKVRWTVWLEIVVTRTKINNFFPGGKLRALFVDNVPSHGEENDVQTALENIKTSLRNLPPNSNDNAKPSDYFVIKKIKDYWRRN